MFDSRSAVIKIGGYILIGLFTLIIVISFGMPDFMSRLGMSDNVVAIVNGEEISHIDFLHYRDNFARRLKNVNSKEIQKFILDSLIRYRLQLQIAGELGIKLHEDSVKRYIKNMPMLNDESGNYKGEYFQRFLDYFHYSLSDFYMKVKEELINEKMIDLINAGIGVSPDEVQTQYIIDNSKIKIKYCFISKKELKTRFKKKIAVSDIEIEEELKKNRDEVKDPKTDRSRIKKKLEKKKIEAIKKEIVDSINKLSVKGKSFNMAAAKLGGKIFYSNVFKIGQPVKRRGKNGKTIHSINNSKVFREQCLAVEIGKTSSVISSFDGLYVFTPVKKVIIVKKPSSSEHKQIVNQLMKEKTNAVFTSMMSSFKEKSEIIKNLKFN